ncbi:MAG: ArnT family glycosyltransferase [Phycisphaeraceae bacterium]
MTHAHDDPHVHAPAIGTKRLLTLLIAITIVAAGLRLGMTCAFVGLSAPPDVGASPDQGEYDAVLQQLIAGNGYAKHDGQPTARRAPGTVFTVLPVYAATGGSYAATRLLIIALSSVTCLLVGLTVARLFNPRAGLIAAGVLAVIPGHTYYAMHLLSEAPFGFWLALAVYLTVLAMQRPKRWTLAYAIAGLCWGMAVLTKPQFVLLAPLVVVASCAYALRQRAWRPALAGAVCVSAAASLVMPWYARNAIVLDAPGLSTIGGYSLWAGNNELTLSDPDWRGKAIPTSRVEAALGVKLPEGEAASDAQAKAYATAFMRQHRADMPRLTVWKLYRLVTPFQSTENRAVYWAQALSWIVVAPLLAAGIVIGLRRRPVQSLLWIGPMLVTLGVTLVFFAIVRYRDALMPAMVPFVALAIDSIWRTLTGVRRDEHSGPIASVNAEAPRDRLAA